MQASSRGITLDQLRTPTNETAEGASGESALTDLHLTDTHNPIALLSGMLHALTPTGSQDTIARTLAALTQRAVGMDLCVVMLVEQDRQAGSTRLSIRASSPDLNGQMLAIPALEVEDSLWKKLCQQARTGQLPRLDVHEQDALNPLDNVAYGSLFIVPLMAGEYCVGLLFGYTSSVRDLLAQEMLILQTMGSYAAMAIANRLLLDAAQTGEPVRALFDDLLLDTPPQEDMLRGRFAALGFDVTWPSVVALVQMVGTTGENRWHDKQQGQDAKEDRTARFSRVLAYVRTRLQVQYPLSLVDTHGQRLRCVVALEHDDAAGLDTWLTALMRQIEVDYGAKLFAGISNICLDIRDYKRCFVEAQEALQIGECLHRYAGSARFSKLGAYRYLYPFARDRRLSDTYLDHIESIARYDREHKRGNLLSSLEIYLALGGNIKEAAEQLKVHRNTLTQRLERIQTICGIDLNAYPERFPLQLALMVYRLRSQDW